MRSGLTDKSSLQAWLQWQETAHSKPIDLGLERVSSVYRKLANPASKLPLTVSLAGTNGKGSSAAMLESIFAAAGYRTGLYSTPHVLNYNERIRIEQRPVDDASICSAFAATDQVRGDVSLSYFEFGTLAALSLFAQADVDIQILEVGLGGRLDAVNIIDADIALITTIDLDHAQWLGTDRSVIATEKAGIFRPRQFAVCADPTVPSSLIDYAQALGTELVCAGKDYRVTETRDSSWSMVPERPFGRDYPNPVLPGTHQIQNAAGVVQVIHGVNERFGDRFPVPKAAIDQGLRQASLLGRMQRVGENPGIWLDVAHNPQSARVLADFYAQQPVSGQRYAILAVMADKEIAGIVEPLLAIVDHWYITTLDIPRAASTEMIRETLLRLKPDAYITSFDSVEQAWQVLQQRLKISDAVVGFGSFYLVEASLRAL